MQNDNVKFKIMVLALTFIGIFGAAKGSEAKNIYVSMTGNDSVTYANNNISHPWLTPQQAFYNAQAGDTVYFRGGTYTIGTSFGDKYHGADGTFGSPITFKAYTGETPIFELGNNMITDERSWYVFDGITFSSTGIALRLAYDLTPSHITVQNCRFTMATGGDNWASIQINAGASNISILNNVFVGQIYPADSHWGAGIIAFRTQGLVIKNNDIAGYVLGIYMKHSNTMADTGVEWAYNYIHDNYKGVSSVANYLHLHDNVFSGNVRDILLCDDGGIGDGGLGCQYGIYDHNTAPTGVDCQEQGNGTCYHSTFTNNIFQSRNDYAAYNAETLYMSSDYNLYPTGNIVDQNRNLYDLPAWRTFNSSDAHSVSMVPTFVGGSSPSTIAGFALTSGSAGHNAASEGKDMGANISLVGPNPGQTPATPPAAPNGLKVN